MAFWPSDLIFLVTYKGNKTFEQNVLFCLFHFKRITIIYFYLYIQLALALANKNIGNDLGYSGKMYNSFSFLFFFLGITSCVRSWEEIL